MPLVALGDGGGYNGVVKRASESPMANVIHKQTTVLPDHRIEVQTPELPAGASVDVVVTSQAAGERHILEFLDSLPRGPHSSDSWKAIDESLRAERDAWDR